MPLEVSPWRKCLPIKEVNVRPLLSEMTTCMSQKPFHKAQGLGSTQTSTLSKLHFGRGEQEGGEGFRKSVLCEEAHP